MISELSLFGIIANATYFALAAVALWGLYCIVVVWNRVAQKRFKTEEEQDVFLDDIDQMLSSGDFDGVREYCEGDPRAVPQMVEYSIDHRQLGYKLARKSMLDRYQRDVMSDLEYRLSWISTVIKSAPMIGLFGTVFGMMGAFKNLSGGGEVDPSVLAGDINLALITTASGLAIAIPLMLAVANLNIKIAKMEDLVGSGVGRYLDSFKSSLARSGGR
jgi:biopolymer transport protein ExbB/TolQ